MAQAVTQAQVLAVVQRARKRDDSHPLIVIKGSPASDMSQITLDHHTTVEVHATRSPLELRRIELSTRTREQAPVVVVTDLEQAELGDDLVARVAGQKIWTPQRWEAVKTIFEVRHIATDLRDRRHLADALIESQPPGGYRPVRGSTLDLQTAIGALLRAQLGLSDAVNNLDRFITWIDDDQNATTSRILAASSALDTGNNPEFDQQLEERFGQGVRAVLAIVRAGKAPEMFPLLFAAGAIHHEDNVNERAVVNLEHWVDQIQLEPASWRHASDAAQRAARSTGFSDSDRRAWSTVAQERLERFGAPELAERSDAIEAGFALRLAQIGRDLATAHAGPMSVPVITALEQSLASARAHWHSDPVRVDRAEMAARLIRRGRDPIEWGRSLATAGAAYRADGAWVDRARNAIARGDSVSELASIYRTLTAELADARNGDNQRFADIAQGAARSLPDDAIGVEDVARQIVAPTAKRQPVLLLIFDGMGYESFTEVNPLFQNQGFTQYLDPDGVAAQPCYAVLPTVTEYSRTSLFAGEVRQGNQSSEGRAFAALTELVDVSSSGNPPVIHHKAALRDGGIDSIPADVLNDIANEHQRIVAVVLNNIDERLKDVAGPTDSWGFDELHPLKWLLQAAREAGRVVIATSDHGHVLDRDAEQRRVEGGKERWRTAIGEPAADEILVEGPRVIPEGNRVILPFAEQVHYDSRRNGYHGGLCPQEVLVPIGVYAASDSLLEGWSPTALPEPDWWIGLRDDEVAEEEVAAAAATSPSRRTKTEPPAEAALTLFPNEADQPTEAPSTEPADDTTWVGTTLEALQQYRRPQIRITDDEIQRLLGALERHGSQAMPIERLAAATQLPATRITRYISQLQQLVNIDGYGVLTVIGSEVHFEKGLLDTQLGSGTN